MPIDFDNELKDRIRMSINIVDLIASYVEVRRQGRGFVARCPFHDDQRPSMQINPDRQSWKCWVCDVGGDAFSFLMQKEGVSFPEALKMLADRAGIVLEEKKSRGKQFSGDQKKLLYDAMHWAAREFHSCLMEMPEAMAAREYLQGRGLTDESITKFNLGFAPDAWTWLLDKGTQQSVSQDSLESVGLLTRNERGTRFDRFRGRIIFPIRDPQGRTIAVGGRVLPGAPADLAKYINCSESRLYQKSHQLYGLDQARETISKTRQAVVMEGYTDVIMAFQHGISNAVACCGTALGESQIQLLKRYCDSVVLLLDGDEAGQRRTSEILELFVSAQMDLRILTLPEELDPCDFLIEHGGSRLQEMIVGAVDALEHKIRSVCRGFDPLLDTHRATSALESILQSLSRVSHRSLLTGDSARIRQDQIIARLSRQFGIEQSEIRIRLDSIRKQASQREQFRREAAQRAQPANAAQVNLDKADPTRIVAKPAIDYRYSELSAVECELFEILALHPELVSMAIERFPITSLGTDTARGLFQLYMDLELGGHSLDFSSVMSATEQPQIKSVLVSVEEHASRKLEKSTMTADERLHSLCARLSNQEDAAYHRSQIRSLEQKQLDEQSELDVLQQIVQQAKVRHGIVPTNR